MFVRLCTAALLFSLVAQSAAADGWVFVNEPGDYKFGYEPSGANNFETLWFRCEAKKITVIAEVGNKLPRSGRATVTITAGGQSATLTGSVSEDSAEFDGVYSLELEISREHPLFSILRSGRALSYTAPGWRRPKLATTGQRENTERFLAACR